MPADLAPIVIIVIVVFGFLFLNLIKRALDDHKRMKLREMIHHERTLAMEKNIPMEDIELDSELLFDKEPRPTRRDGVVWLRLLALFLGLALFFGGIGMCIAFTMSTHPDLTQVWLIGLIPSMVGLGLLLFYFMTGKVETAAARST